MSTHVVTLWFSCYQLLFSYVISSYNAERETFVWGTNISHLLKSWASYHLCHPSWLVFLNKWFFWSKNLYSINMAVCPQFGDFYIFYDSPPPTPTVPTQNHPNCWFNALSLHFDYHLSPRCCCMLSKCSIICSILPTQLWYWPHQLRIYFLLQLVTSLQCSLFIGHCMFYVPWHSQLSEHDLLVLRAISPGSM